MTGRLMFLLVAVLWTSSLTAAEQYERRLIPVAVGLAPGAFGSTWSTRVEAAHTGIHIVGDMDNMPKSIGNFQPHGIFPLPSEQEPPGAILYVLKDVAELVHISARIVQTGASLHEETPIPVVREGDFAARTLYFLQLKNSADERVRLRVYSLDLDHPDPAVRVRVQATWLGALRGWTFVYDQVHQLDVRQKQTFFDGQIFFLRSLAAEISLDGILDTLPEDAQIAVSVLPASENLRIWAMLSETSNSTQRVRVVPPQ
jgi:hypothetical protein